VLVGVEDSEHHRQHEERNLPADLRRCCEHQTGNRRAGYEVREGKLEDVAPNLQGILRFRERDDDGYRNGVGYEESACSQSQHQPMRTSHVVECRITEQEARCRYCQSHVAEVEDRLHRVELLRCTWQALNERREARYSQSFRRAHLGHRDQDERQIHRHASSESGQLHFQSRCQAGHQKERDNPSVIGRLCVKDSVRQYRKTRQDYERDEELC